jgi:hypothetical protein
VAAGLAGVLLTRGPGVVLPKGTMLEMVLDRPLIFEPAELDFSGAPQNRPIRVITAPEQPAEKSSLWPFPF